MPYPRDLLPDRHLPLRRWNDSDVTGHGIAHVTALADTVEAVVGFAEVPAAVKLADVATDCSGFPDMRRSSLASCLGQSGVFAVNNITGGNVL